MSRRKKVETKPEPKHIFVYFCGKCQKTIENPWGTVQKMVNTGEFYSTEESRTVVTSTYKTICMECYNKIQS